MSNRRLLIVVGKGAQAKLLVCDHSDESSVRFLASQVCEIFVDDDAVFDYYDMEESSENTAKVASVFVRQGGPVECAGQRHRVAQRVTRSNYSLDLRRRARRTVALRHGHRRQGAVGPTLILISTTPFRIATATSCSNMCLTDSARGSFCGRILVRHGAQKTEAYQGNKNLCASPLAKMYTKPQLEIYARRREVQPRSHHRAARPERPVLHASRGFTEAEARMLLMFAFTNDVIEQVRLDALKDRLRQLVEKRFRGELAKCSGCQACR